MYEPETILELKQPREDQKIAAKKDPDTGRTRKAQTVPFPYNRVKVIGESPVDHGGAPGSTWSGTGARGVIIAPLTGFGATLDEPLGKLQKLYKVVEEPKREIEIVPIKVVNATTAAAGPTPEEVFAQTSPGTPPKDGQTRARTPMESPLGEVEDESAKSPLDDVLSDDDE